ncbi:MAG: hypothetical protein COB40_04645 [Marinosulfonomonas sp.]|nr:MAG: hypothetical protein COB40_04645 [Marinosulfonomonas sp.]
MLVMAPPEEHKDVWNHPHQHAFTLVGDKQFFGVHMTQYHCEIHKYQIILKLSFAKKADADKLRKMRRSYPSDFFVLCNQKNDDEIGPQKEFSIPDLASGRRSEFVGDIFQGIRWPDEEPDEHFFPWSKDRCAPAIKDVRVTVERIVLFRPFAHHEQLPPYATYWLFGDGDEAHMTNLQNAALASNPFQAAAFGPDYDHVMSLQKAPDWLDAPLLEAGVIVTVPAVPLVDFETGEPTIPCEPLFRAGEPIEVLYRGIGPARHVTAGHSFLQCTAVCNSESMIPCPENPCYISPMPEKYWR